jgi:hypothetical protein
MQAALLLLLRGVKSVALNTVATTSHTNAELLQGLMKGLGEGLSLGAAVLAAEEGPGVARFELEAVRGGGMVVYGLPHVVADDGGGGKAGGKGGGAKGKGK